MIDRTKLKPDFVQYRPISQDFSQYRPGVKRNPPFKITIAQEVVF